MQDNPKTLGAFLWYFLRHHKLALSYLLFVGLIWSVEMSLSPYLLKIIIDTAITFQANPDKFILAVTLPAIIYVSLSVILNITFRGLGYTFLKMFPVLRASVVTYVFSALSKRSYTFFQTNFAGTIAKKISDLGESVEAIVQIPYEMFYPRVLAIIISAAFLSLAQPIFSLIIVVWSSFFVTVTLLIAKRGERYAAKLAESRTLVDGIVVDSVTNVLNTRIFSNQAYELERVDDSLSKVVIHDRKMQWFMLKTHFFQGLSVTVLIGTLLYTLIQQRTAGLVTIGDFAFVLTLSMTVVQTVFFVGSEIVRFTKEVGKAKQALSLLSSIDSVQDVADAKPLVVRAGEIEFDQVTFHYDQHQHVFDSLTVRIKPGEKVGLVGYSGGGKSSFVNLILRLFEPESGMIRIDGQNIAQVTQHSLRQQIGMIPQDPQLFHRTIKENIRYGDIKASDESVVAAAKKAHCHNFILALKDGYDTKVGERGIKLSGGQRQRIAIARVILKQAPILLLDEATSALDSVTEKYIQESLHEAMADRTTIVIAHRLSTLLNMDRILVFHEGAIVDDGTFDELSTKKGLFAEFWQGQAKKN